MNRYFRKILSAVLIVATAVVFAIPRDLIAYEDHLVSSTELQQSVIAAAQSRAEKIVRIRHFFGSELGTQVLKRAGVTSTKLESVLPRLSNDELAQLSMKTDAVQSNFAAGYHEHELITILIIVLLVVAIIVIVAEVAD